MATTTNKIRDDVKQNTAHFALYTEIEIFIYCSGMNI